MITFKFHKRYINLSLIIIFLSLFIFKVYKIPTYKDGDALFSGNSALNYRYARMVALYGKISSFDKELGFPDGFSVKFNYPFFMESFAGHLYRILPNNIPFHIYLLIFMSFYSSIIVFAVYLISFSVWEERKVAIISTIIFVTTLATSKNIINVEFKSLDFALPFILFNLYYYIKVKKLRQEGIESKESFIYDLFSGVLLFIAIASYEFLPIYILVIAITAWIISLVNKKIDISFIILSLIVILAGFVLPNLRGTYFLVSIPMLIVYSLLVSFLLKKRMPWIMPLISITLIVIFILLTLNGIIKEPYISELIIKIIKIVGNKLAYILRIGPTKNLPGWENLYICDNLLKPPTIKNTLFSYGLLLPMGLYGLFLGFRGWKKGYIKQQEQIILLFGVFSLIIYLFSESFEIFVSFILSLLLTYVIKKFKNKTIFIILLITIPNIFFLYNFKGRRSKIETNYLMQVIKFIRAETAEGSPILCENTYSPSFLTYSNRPININPLDNSNSNIKKMKEFEHKLYLSEKDFYKFCSKNRVRYFVYHKDMLLDKGRSSLRCRTNNLKISKTSPAYLFHFEPQELREFILVFSNPSFRVYEVHYADIQPNSMRLEYLRAYDLERYNLEELGIR